jgi:hypothetical protein
MRRPWSLAALRFAARHGAPTRNNKIRVVVYRDQVGMRQGHAGQPVAHKGFRRID